MIQNPRFVSALAIFGAIGFIANANAEVRVYQLQQPPTVLQSPARSGNPLSNLYGFLGRSSNHGSAKETVYRFISENQLIFGIQNPGPQTLPLRKMVRTERGMSLRFAQVMNGIPVDGAELIAIFNNQGELESVNSSIKPVNDFSAAPEISRTDALAIATRELKFENAELGNDMSDGLKVVVTPEGPTLVWQLSIREGSDGSNSLQVQVIASGPKKGQILQSVRIGQSISGNIDIYDASVTVIIPNPLYKGMKVLHNGKRTRTGFVRNVDVAKETHKTLSEAGDYYQKVFNRDSYDGNGASLVASVNVGKRFSKYLDPLGMKQNAAWVGPWKMFAFGAGGTLLGSFTGALDVVAHEFTHAVVETTAKLDYKAQSGALNEHLADLFGAAAQKYTENSENPFLIGEKCLKGPLLDPKAGSGGLRDMLDPHKSLNVGLALGSPDADPYGQPAEMSEVPEEYADGCVPGDGNDNCGVHLLNGIPNRAMALAIEKADWDTITRLAYTVMTTRLLSTSDFANYRDQLLEECSATLPAGTCSSIRGGFEAVGL